MSTWFTVRVQLSGQPASAVYDALHELMALHGYIRAIEADDGPRYWLPHAEYFARLGWTREPLHVVGDVEGIVAKLWDRAEIVAGRVDAVAWSGLERAPRHAIRGVLGQR